ncbi:MAG TPA: hypothetical protein VN706_04880 [Gemmatimonadaceae bacterium]|nr:hypothetical protein [Gemmatimonadaceae bacterium]
MHSFAAQNRGKTLIVGGACYFIFALAVSAVFVPEVRLLHVAQAALYVATIVLALRQSRWGYFIGASIGIFWDLLATFGSALFSDWVATPARPDLILQVLGWWANLAVVIGSAIGYRRLANKSRGDAASFITVFIGTTAFLVAATAMLAPSYLSHLATILHPHWPWHPSP